MLGPTAHSLLPPSSLPASLPPSLSLAPSVSLPTPPLLLPLSSGNSPPRSLSCLTPRNLSPPLPSPSLFDHGSSPPPPRTTPLCSFPLRTPFQSRSTPLLFALSPLLSKDSPSNI